MDRTGNVSIGCMEAVRVPWKLPVPSYQKVLSEARLKFMHAGTAKNQ